MSITTEAKTSSGVSSSFCINRAHRVFFRAIPSSGLGLDQDEAGTARAIRYPGWSRGVQVQGRDLTGKHRSWLGIPLEGRFRTGLRCWISGFPWMWRRERAYTNKKWNLFNAVIILCIFCVFFNYNCYRWVFLRNGNPLLKTNLGLRRNTDASPPMWLSFIYMYFYISSL